MSDPEFRETAWAKINLALHVVGARADGYHDLESLVVFTEFGDQLCVTPAQADHLTLSGPFAKNLAFTAPQSSPNLVLDTLAKFRARHPDILPAGLHIHLEKNLPIASGIGGGSADAAATLRLIARYTGTQISPQQFTELAAEIGADVPMCLAAQTSLVTGIGTRITPLKAMPPLHLALVNPLVALSTPAMFSALGRTDNPPLSPLGSGFSNIADLSDWLSQTRNDLQSPAQIIAPEISQIIDHLAKTKANIAARMSGSGATVFGLYATQAEAQNAAQKIKSENKNWWVVTAKIR